MIEPPPEGIERRPVTTAARILLGGPVALVTTHDRGSDNVLPVAWHMPLSAEPPLVGIALERSRHSLELIRSSEQFALNFPARPLLHTVQYLGGYSGEHIDKLEATQFESFAATHIDAPLLQGCLAWIECELQDVLPFGDHELCIGLAVAVHVDPQSFDGRWLLGPEETRPLHFLGGHEYSALEGVLKARLPQSFEAPDEVLADRIAEELELTEESRERREQRLGEIERELEAGNIVDVSELADEELPPLDLSTGVVIGEPPKLED